jgi:DNA mismatch repair protein MutS2
MLEKEWNDKLAEVNAKIDDLNKQKEKISAGARAESRKIIADRTERAEELLAELEEIFNREEIEQSDLIKARTIKNQLKNINYEQEEKQAKITNFEQATEENVTKGASVYVIPMQTDGVVIDFNKAKNQVEVSCNGMRLRLKLSQIEFIEQEKKEEKSVKVVKKLVVDRPVLEINVLGLTVPEAIYEVDNFIDRAVLDNLEEIKVIHGFGMGKLRKAIAQHLKSHKNVKDFRPGKYGEGEQGVTIITLK